jgi:hypothetical protein
MKGKLLQTLFHEQELSEIHIEKILQDLTTLQASESPEDIRIGLAAAIIFSKVFNKEILSKEDFLKAFKTLQEKSLEEANNLLNKIKGDENLKDYMPSEE